MYSQRLFLILILSFLTSKIFAMPAMHCAVLYSAHYKNVVAISEALSHHQFSDPYDNSQRVFLNKTLSHEDAMVFDIPRGDLRWDSKFNAVLRSDTPHRDPRYIFYILGPEVAALLGYKIEFLDSQLGVHGRIQITAPGVQAIHRKIIEINAAFEQVLHAEPIGFVNLPTGMVKAREMLEATTQVEESLEYGFPFHQKHELLTPHELSLHSNFLVPRELLRRARNINIVVMEFADLLRESSNPALTFYAHLIEASRSLENDLGSGLSTRTLAQGLEERMNRPVEFQSQYSQWRQNLAGAITTWSRPTLTAFEVLLQQLIMHDPSFGFFLSRHEKQWMENLGYLENYPKDSLDGYVESKLAGTASDHQQLLSLLRRYQKVHRKNLRPSLTSRKSASTWADVFFEGHEARTRDVLKALLILKNFQKVPQ